MKHFTAPPPRESSENAPAQRKICVLLQDRVYLSSYAIFSDVIGIANRVLHEKQCESGLFTGKGPHEKPAIGALHIHLLSGKGESVTSVENQCLAVNGPISGLSDCKLLYLPATNHQNEQEIDDLIQKNQGLLPHLVRHWESGNFIAASGSSVFLLAEAGLLDEKLVTTSWQLKPILQRRYRSAIWAGDKLVSKDQRILCARAMEAEVHLSCYAVEVMLTRWFSELVSSIVLTHGSENHYQPANPEHSDEILLSTDQLIARAQYWLADHLYEDFTLNQLAEELCISTRTLSRRFKQSLGITPKAHIRKLRMEAAHRMLHSPSMKFTSIQSIASHVGYQDLDYFSRLYRNYYGVTPFKR